jgi:hypothetical protein
VATGLTVTPDGDPIVCARMPSSALVARLTADGSGVVFSTTLDGKVDTVAVAPGGAILVAGRTSAEDLPLAGRLLGSPTGGTEAFLAELDPESGDIRRAALLGDGLVIDISASASKLLLLGRTSMDDFPAAPAPHGPPGEAEDAFLLELDAADWEIGRAALYGGSATEYYLTMDVAPDGTVWMAGSTDSEDLPLSGAIRSQLCSSEDAFVAAFAAEDLTLLFSTYLGGEARDLAGGIAAADDGSAWIAGATGSDDFPTVDPVQGRASSSPWYDVFLARLFVGDPAGRPPTPEDLDAEVLGGNAVRLDWEDRSSGKPGFTVYRREVGGFSRVAFVPGGATEWTDATVLPDRSYVFTVQAVGDAGGSASSEPAAADTPPTLDVRIDRGTHRYVPDMLDGRSRLRLKGAVVTNEDSGDGAYDPRDEGIEWILSPPGQEDLGPSWSNVRLLEIPADDPGWRTTRRFLRWKSDRVRLRVDPATGRFVLRVKSYGWLLWPDDARRMRITVGDDSGSATPAWRSVRRYRQRIP